MPKYNLHLSEGSSANLSHSRGSTFEYFIIHFALASSPRHLIFPALQNTHREKQNLKILLHVSVLVCFLPLFFSIYLSNATTNVLQGMPLTCQRMTSKQE